MKTEIEKAVLFLVNQIKDGVSADRALKYTQAALNIANVGLVLRKTGLELKDNNVLLI